jgi:hypothetical protein
VSQLDNTFAIYCSGDSGETWEEATGVPMIADLEFDTNGILYGIFPDHSNSSGLWYSNDYGMTWDVEFYADDMSAIGLDAFNNIFTGWESDMGIAMYDPLAPPPGLTFMNDGLASLNINAIQKNPTMSAPAIFICTDSGAYYSYDYLTGITPPRMPEKNISIYPNPVHDNIFIHTRQDCRQMQVISLTAGVVNTIMPSSYEVKLDVSHLSRGIYILQCVFRDGTVSRKVIVE